MMKILLKKIGLVSGGKDAIHALAGPDPERFVASPPIRMIVSREEEMVTSGRPVVIQ
jgi:hypothetical protein